MMTVTVCKGKIRFCVEDFSGPLVTSGPKPEGIQLAQLTNTATSVVTGVKTRTGHLRTGKKKHHGVTQYPCQLLLSDLI